MPTPARRPLFALFLFLAHCPLGTATQGGWPQGSGPLGNWAVEGPAPPVAFSGETGDGVLWRTALPETGQGGIAVVAGRIYIATMAPWDGVGLSEEDADKFAHAIEKRTVVGKDIDAHCLDAATGEMLWTRRIAGTIPSIYSYPFSDATSPSPVATDEHVWFTNGGGCVVCFTRDGEEVWRRDFVPTFDGPFNKQFEPFLVPDPARGEGAATFVHMEPRPAPEGAELVGDWNHLAGLDAETGKLLWWSSAALTHYNTPTLVHTDKETCVLHARGGPHAVPERPVGMSLTLVTGPDAGSEQWRYEDRRGNHEAALQTMSSDGTYAYWLLKEPRSALVVIDLVTGRELREISLVKNVTLRSFDAEVGAHRTREGVDLDKGVFPARYSMHAVDGRVFFQCYATAWGKPTIGPPYSFARVTVGASSDGDRVEYLEVPTGRADTQQGEQRGPYAWRTPRKALALNARGQEVTGDPRSRWDGWDWVFNGTPTRVNDRLYHTLATGAVYVLATGPGPFGPEALLSLNDLGPDGRTWSANSVSYAGGRLYHRTARELLCIGEE